MILRPSFLFGHRPAQVGASRSTITSFWMKMRYILLPAVHCPPGTYDLPGTTEDKSQLYTRTSLQHTARSTRTGHKVSQQGIISRWLWNFKRNLLLDTIIHMIHCANSSIHTRCVVPILAILQQHRIHHFIPGIYYQYVTRDRDHFIPWYLIMIQQAETGG